MDVGVIELVTDGVTVLVGVTDGVEATLEVGVFVGVCVGTKEQSTTCVTILPERVMT